MTIQETTAEVLHLLERANARQMTLILRMVRVVLGEGARA
jgi:hypothetical protein